MGPATAMGTEDDVAALARIDRVLASPLTGFAPWVALYVVGGAGRVTLACAVALAMSVVTLAAQKARGAQLKLLSYADTVAFSAFLLGSFVAAPSTIAWCEDWFSESGYLFVVVVLAGSLLARRPLSVEFAKEHVEAQYWDTPEFRHVNVVVTTVWMLAFLGAAVAGLVTDLVLQYDDNIWTNWVLPIASVMVAVAFTTWYARNTMAVSLRRAGLPTDPARPVWDLWRVVAAFLVPMGLASLVFDGGPPALGVALVLGGSVLQHLCARRADAARASDARRAPERAGALPA